MIPEMELVVLDTNILVHAIRESITWRTIESRLHLRSRAERPIISQVTIGELFALAEKAQSPWGLPKRERLRELVREMLVVDLSRSGVIEHYARIDSYSERSGHNMGKNDIWIAATAIAASAVLITTDADFDHLHPRFLRVLRIDPKTNAFVVLDQTGISNG